MCYVEIFLSPARVQQFFRWKIKTDQTVDVYPDLNLPCQPTRTLCWMPAHLYIQTHNMEYRGSYMSVHVLLNLLNELRKRDKMPDLSSILSLFGNKSNKFNNTGALSFVQRYNRWHYVIH